MQRGRTFSALRLMKIVGYFKVSQENEDTLYGTSLASIRLVLSLAVEEEQSLDEFFSQWECSSSTT